MNNRNVLLKNILIILVAIGIIVSYSFLNPKLKIFEKNMFYMDTYINVKIYVKDKNEAEKIFIKVEEVYNKYQKLTNVYDTNSDLYKLNHTDEAEKELVVNSNIYDMLKLAEEYKELSNGKFNVNIGNLIDVWKKYRDLNSGIPTKDELLSASKSIDNIMLLEDNKIINKNLNINLGAIVKGYATNEAANVLKENNIKNYIINAGGNVEVGEPYNKDKYNIGIENPTDKNKIYQVVKGKNISVVTSGGYERFYEYNGSKYHHIIDPTTLYPANNMQSVTVVTENGKIADVLSTTLFLLPINEALDLVNSIPNTEAIFYLNDNTIIKSEGFNKYE